MGLIIVPALVTLVAPAEAEANLRLFRERHVDKATKLWINLCTLTRTHPLAKIRILVRKRFKSPLQRIAAGHSRCHARYREAIAPYVLAPWDARLRSLIITDMDRSNEVLQAHRQGKAKSEWEVPCKMAGETSPATVSTHTPALSDHEPSRIRTWPNSTAVAEGLARLGPAVQNLEIRIFTRKRAATQAISQPKSRSGQQIIRQIYVEVERLRGRNNRITLI